MKTLRIIQRRFMKGLREAPYEFVAPLLAASRWLWGMKRFVSHNPEKAMDEALAKTNKNKDRN